MNWGFNCFNICICICMGFFLFCLQMPTSVYWKLQNVPPILNVLILTRGTRVDVRRVTRKMDPFARVCLLFNIFLFHTMRFFSQKIMYNKMMYIHHFCESRNIFVIFEYLCMFFQTNFEGICLKCLHIYQVRDDSFFTLTFIFIEVLSKNWITLLNNLV